jgi:hypothetical protein
MYWVKGERDVPAVYQNRHLRKAITAVLQQLYDRKYVQLYTLKVDSLGNFQPDGDVSLSWQLSACIL